jgi:ubiquitin-protein ligase
MDQNQYKSGGGGVSIGSGAALRLSREYAKLKTDPIDNVTFQVDENNILNWTFTLLGPHESPYEGGQYNGIIKFPSEYPNKPPMVKFTSKIFHPNVHEDGKVCISILHEGNDVTGYEHELERWRQIQNVRTVFLSIISLLNDPNPESAANIDAAKLFREDLKSYYLKIRKDME